MHAKPCIQKKKNRYKKKHEVESAIVEALHVFLWQLKKYSNKLSLFKDSFEIQRLVSCLVLLNFIGQYYIPRKS